MTSDLWHGERKKLDQCFGIVSTSEPRSHLSFNSRYFLLLPCLLLRHRPAFSHERKTGSCFLCIFFINNAKNHPTPNRVNGEYFSRCNHEYFHRPTCKIIKLRLISKPIFRSNEAAEIRSPVWNESSDKAGVLSERPPLWSLKGVSGGRDENAPT